MIIIINIDTTNCIAVTTIRTFKILKYFIFMCLKNRKQLQRRDFILLFKICKNKKVAGLYRNLQHIKNKLILKKIDQN